MRIRFAVGTGRNENISEVSQIARVAEEYGFSFLTFLDSQNLSRDVYAMMTIAALNTHRIHIGQAVTVPFTRHPSVTANATATVNEVSGGRALLGIGSGGSAVWTMGMKARPLETLRETVLFIKEYVSGKEAVFNGARMHSEWIKDTFPVYIGARGPKALRLAGEIADGVFFSGYNPEVVKWAMEQVEKGALRVGRNPSEIDFWARGMIYVTDSKEDALREAGAYAAHVARLFTLLQRNDPDTSELRGRIERAQPGVIEELKKIHDAWSAYQHELRDTPAAKMVTDRVNRFVNFVGKPEDICEGVHKLEELGVNTVSTVLYTVTDKKGMIREIGDKIMPHFRN